MGKDKIPRKRTKPARRKKAARTSPTAPPHRVDADVVPAARPELAAVGAGVPERPRPAVDRWLRLLRSAVGALLDVADAAAGAITKGRGHRTGI